MYYVCTPGFLILNTQTFVISQHLKVLNTCIVRPIVSCCGSPTEKLALLFTKALSPVIEHLRKHRRLYWRCHQSCGGTHGFHEPIQIGVNQCLRNAQGSSHQLLLRAIVRVNTFQRQSNYITSGRYLWQVRKRHWNPVPVHLKPRS